MLVPSLMFFSHFTVIKLPLPLLDFRQLEPVLIVSVLDGVDCIFFLYLRGQNKGKRVQ